MPCRRALRALSSRLLDGALVTARDVTLAAGSQLDIGSGRVELAQQWTNQGSATAGSGGVTRVASAGCPLVGAAGPVLMQAPPTPQPVPLPPGGSGSGSGGGGGGGTAQVAIGVPAGPGLVAGLPPGCAITSLTIDAAASADNLPQGATAPLGVLRFTATGCPGTTLHVSISYPPGSLAGLTVQKYGPHGAPAQTGWFSPSDLAVGSGVAGDTVSYTVVDNGAGDNDAAVGTIADPLAPLWLGAGPAPGGPQAIPTLGAWGVLLLSLLTSLAARPALRRWRRSA